jgi:hypothetical protein
LLEPADTSLPAVKFETCDVTTSNKEVLIDESLFQISPTLVSDVATLTWNTEALDLKNVQIIRMDGQSVFSAPVDSQSGYFRLDMTSLSSGMYIVLIQSEQQIGLKKIMRLH